jgi:hypothetical protein
VPHLLSQIYKRQRDIKLSTKRKSDSGKHKIKFEDTSSDRNLSECSIDQKLEESVMRMIEEGTYPIFTIIRKDKGNYKGLQTMSTVTRKLIQVNDSMLSLHVRNET